jgi:hypothetical protein
VPFGVEPPLGSSSKSEREARIADDGLSLARSSIRGNGQADAHGTKKKRLGRGRPRRLAV